MALQPLYNGSSSIGEPPVASVLKQNYPNPFNPQTEISLSLQETGFASLVRRRATRSGSVG